MRPADGRPPFGARTGRERAERRRLAIGLAASVVVHLVLLLVVGGVRIGVLDVRPMDATREAPPFATVVVLLDIVEPPEDAPEEEAAAPQAAPDRPTEREEEEEEEGAVDPRPARDPLALPPVVGEAEAEEDVLSNAERLQPRMGDERLWIDFREPPFQVRRLEAYARADSALRAILGEWLDSLQLTDEEYRRARDWTIGVGDGRWGISPEGLHLGDITIPIPFGILLQESGPRAREARRALQDLMEIRRQDLRDDLEEVARERREEMRRRSREEAERRHGEDSTSARRPPG